MWMTRIASLTAAAVGAATIWRALHAPLPEAYSLVFSSLPDAFVGAFLLGFGTAAWFMTEILGRAKRPRQPTRWVYVRERQPERQPQPPLRCRALGWHRPGPWLATKRKDGSAAGEFRRCRLCGRPEFR